MTCCCTVRAKQLTDAGEFGLAIAVVAMLPVAVIIAPFLEHQTILERLKTVLRLPSVSTDPAYADGMAATRAHFLQRLKEMGLDNVQLLDGGGHPALYGAWRGAPGAPTIIIYGHYDVQPPDPLELWHTPPFDPTIRDGRLYARGASDVKGSTTIAVEAVAAFLAVSKRYSVNVKFFLGGEEEIGRADRAQYRSSDRAEAGPRRRACRGQRALQSAGG